MGLIDRIRNSMRKEIKKEEKSLAKKYHGTELTKEQIRKMAAQNYVKKGLGKIALGAVVATMFTGAVKGENKPIQEPVAIETETSSMIDGLKEGVANPTSDFEEKLAQIDGIDSKEDAFNFIKDIYLEEYNKVNGTNLERRDINFYYGKGGTLFDIKDKDTIISGGSEAISIENMINDKGMDYEIVNKDKDVYVYGFDKDEEFLEIIAKGVDSNYKVITPGDKWSRGKISLATSDKSFLCDMGDVAEDVRKISEEYSKNGVTQEKIKNLEEYKANLKNNYVKYVIDTDKNIKRNVEMGVR